tara:strand:- start:11646 stop:12692 length:1047 start_codon:yes stop_codon:yes gene_type:complete
MKNFVLISSPLQALVFWIIYNSHSNLNEIKFTIFIEDGYMLPSHPNLKIIYIHSTRGNKFDAIKKNIKLIDNESPNDITLWISDLLWPMNNACYSFLQNRRCLFKVNFFDEGMVMYWQEKLNLYRYLKEVLKFKVYEFKHSISFSNPKRMLFYDNHKNGDVYAIHPKLLKYKKRTHQIIIEDAYVNSFRHELAGYVDFQDSIYNQDSKNVLFLSQPFYRVTDLKNFKNVIYKLITLLKKSGYEKLYVKMHPSESISDFNNLYKELGFEMAFDSSILPVEAYLSKLNSKSSLVSFNSSALLNAKEFGFKGDIISAGLDWVSSLYPAQKISLMKQKELFISSGVTVKKLL